MQRSSFKMNALPSRMATRPVACVSARLGDRTACAAAAPPRPCRGAALRCHCAVGAESSGTAETRHGSGWAAPELEAAPPLSARDSAGELAAASAAPLSEAAPAPSVISQLQAPGLAVLAAVGGGLLGTGLDASGPGSVAQAVGVLAAIVAFHELGHFTAARAQGIRVTKFSVGFGPSLYSYQGKEVEYSLRLIPLGGYVAFPDDDPESGIPPDDPDLLRNRPLAQRALVISAGIIANVLLAYTVLLLQVGTVGTPALNYYPGVQAPQVLARSAAARAGLQAGDLILGINNEALLPSPTSVKRVVDIIKDNPGREVVLTVQRGEQKPFRLPVTPDLAPRDNGGVIGVKLGANARMIRTFAKGPVDALRLAGSEFMRLGSQITSGLQQIVFNFGAVQDKISGPVAIVNVGAEVARTDISGLFQFAALVNLNLAVVNALPLPALDGGYLALLALEAVRKKKLDQVVEQSIMASGLLLLMGAGLVLVVRDLSHLAG